VSDRWLYGWGLASIGLGGASLVVPLYVVELGGGPVTLGILAAAAAGAGAPGALVVGRLADRTGHRRGYVLSAVAVVAAGLAVVAGVESIAVVVAANAAVWFAFAATTPVLTLLAVVGAPESEWSDRITRLNEWQGVGWALGLLVGFCVLVGGERLIGLEARTALRAVCLVCGTSAAAGWLVTARALPADPGPGAGPAPRRLRRSLRGATRFGVRGAGFPFTPARMDFRGLHPRRFVRRFTPGLALRAVALPAVVVVNGLLVATLPLFVLVGVTWAVIAVSAATLVTRLSPPIVRGEALGVYGALSTVASGVGSVGGGWLAASGYTRAFGAAGGLILTGAGIVVVLRWRVGGSAAGAERSVYSTDSTE
jgi:MFS family permease